MWTWRRALRELGWLLLFAAVFSAVFIALDWAVHGSVTW